MSIFEVLRLPLKYRTIIQLFYYEDLTIEEISEIMKVNSNTIKTRLRRARENLKPYWKEDLKMNKKHRKL